MARSPRGEPHPLAYDLCAAHADRSAVPRGWRSQDRRDARAARSSRPAGRLLTAPPRACRASGREPERRPPRLGGRVRWGLGDAASAGWSPRSSARRRDRRASRTAVRPRTPTTCRSGRRRRPGRRCGLGSSACRGGRPTARATGSSSDFGLRCGGRRAARRCVGLVTQLAIVPLLYSRLCAARRTRRREEPARELDRPGRPDVGVILLVLIVVHRRADRRGALLPGPACSGRSSAGSARGWALSISAVVFGVVPLPGLQLPALVAVRRWSPVPGAAARPPRPRRSAPTWPSTCDGRARACVAPMRSDPMGAQAP